MEDRAKGDRTLTLVLMIVVVGLLNRKMDEVAREMKAGPRAVSPSKGA